MAKGRDHDIMRALEIHPKAIPQKIEIEFCVGTGFKCRVNANATGLSTKSYFITILFMWGLLHNKF